VGENQVPAAQPGRSARFLTVLRIRRSLLGCVPLLGVAWAVRACAVFPDQAVLTGAGGVNAGGVSSAAGQGSLPEGGVGEAGVGSVEGGAAGLANAGGSLGRAGEPGAGGVEAGGEGGAGGVAECAAPHEVVLPVVADTWIDAAKPSTSQGADASLIVFGGTEERRALLTFTLPTPPAAAVLRSATLRLYLAGNADASLAERRLVVHPLARELDEGRTTWNNYANGSGSQWTTPGGDFGPGEESTLSAPQPGGFVAFDVTALVGDAPVAASSSLGWLIREQGQAPNAPAELVFASREGNAAQAPSLTLGYCRP